LALEKKGAASAGSLVEQGVWSVIVVGMNPLENRLHTAASELSPGAGIGLAGGDLEESLKAFSCAFVVSFEG